MSAQEFSEWMVFDSIEPIGERRADVRAAQLLAFLAAALSDEKSTRPSVEQFVPDYWGSRVKRAARGAWQSIASVMDALAGGRR